VALGRYDIDSQAPTPDRSRRLQADETTTKHHNAGGSLNGANYLPAVLQGPKTFDVGKIGAGKIGLVRFGAGSQQQFAKTLYAAAS